MLEKQGGNVDTIESIRNYIAIDERLSTSGQPSEAQFAALAQAGFEVVINLGLHDDPRYSLRDEPGCVQALHMDYIHIPVLFKAPTETDLTAFFGAMDANRDRKTLVHCAANIRVSVFLGLYRVLKEKCPSQEAFALMQTVLDIQEKRGQSWDEATSQTWTAFIDSMLTHSA